VAIFLWKRHESKRADAARGLTGMNSDVKLQAGLMPQHNCSEVDNGWRVYEADSQLHRHYASPGHTAELL
jgi:hypothetical protein